MQNMIEICKEFGFEVPSERTAEFNKKVAENYRTVADYNKQIGKVETDRDAWKQKAETAEETLKGFEGVDLQTIQNEISTYKKRAEDAEKEYSDKLYARDFEDALKTELESYTFTSEAAKKSVIADIKAAELKLKDGKILGLNDLIEQIKTTDASAFTDKDAAEREANRVKFTMPQQPTFATDKSSNKSEIMKIADRSQRRAAILQNIKLFDKGE